MLTFKELSTALSFLTQGHFWFYVSLLKRWDLCNNLVRHFWQRWSSDYLTSINKYSKWKHPNSRIQSGDLYLSFMKTLHFLRSGHWDKCVKYMKARMVSLESL